MSDVTSTNNDLWAKTYTSEARKRLPDENIVRLIKGSWGDVPRSGRALDVGFGFGADLLFLAEHGFEAHGLEVNQVNLDEVGAEAARRGLEMQLGLLDGTALAYPDGHFDLVLSWCAIYYLGSRTLVAESLQEIHRVLKPGGALLLSVLHPNSWMVRRLAFEADDGGYVIDRAHRSDDRRGMQIFYDGTSSGWRRLLGPFSQIDEGYVEFDLFVPETRDAWRLFLAHK